MNTVDDNAGGGFPRTLLAIAVAALLVGLGIRVWMNCLAPQWAYHQDHFDNIGMGVTAEQHGLLKVYSVPVQDNPVIRGTAFSRTDQQPRLVERQVPRVANYPPLAVTVFYLQAKGLRAIDPSVEANTVTARIWMSAVSVAMELLLAVGMFLLVRELAGPKAGIVAAIVCWLLPPLWLDSSFWGQTDSWVLAPVVFAIWLMLRNRWLLAGAVLGATAMLKPQAIMLGPVVLFAAAILPARGDSGRVREFALRVVKATIAGIAAVAVISLPWWIADGAAWLQESYINNFKMYPLTTMKAFNFWYADALLADTTYPRSGNVLSSVTDVGGMTKDAWGKLLVLAAGVVAGVLCWRKYRSRPGLAVVLFAGIWLWSIFVWPTRVHERYIVYSMPLVIAAAMCLKRLWPALIILALVGAAEMTWPNWLGTAAGQFNPRRVNATYDLIERRHGSLPPSRRSPLPARAEFQARSWLSYQQQRRPNRPWEWLATVALLSAYGLAFALPFVRPASATNAASAERARRTAHRPGQKKRRAGPRRR